MFFYHMRRYRWFAALVSMLLAVVILLSAVTSQVRANSIYVIPDTVNNVYSYAMTVNNGNPVLSYYSNNTNNIVVAICGNPSCQTDLTVIRPIESIVPRGIAVTIVNGNPFIAYSTIEGPDPNMAHLRAVACVDPLCSQPPIVTTLDQGSFFAVAMTLQNGKALIAYENFLNIGDHNIIRLAICNNAACTAPTIQPLSLTDTVKGDYGIGVGLLNGNPIVAYRTWDTYPIRLAKCASPTCAETPTLITVDANVSNTAGITLTVAANTPIITYTTVENGRSWLKVATCTDSTCDAPMYIHTVDEVTERGNSSATIVNGFFVGDTSVTLINGLPVIAYYRAGIRIATCLDIVCNYASSTFIADANHVSPVIQVSHNKPVVSFYQTFEDTQYKYLKVYFGGSYHPLHSPTPSRTPTNTPNVPPSATPTLLSGPPTATFTITPSITPTPSLTLTPSNTPITPTAAPSTAPKINFYTTDRPTLSWNRVSWATGYKIQISMDKNFAPAATFTQVLPADSLAYTTQALAIGTYYWRVMALGGTVSAWSNVSSFVISIPPSPTDDF